MANFTPGPVSYHTFHYCCQRSPASCTAQRSPPSAEGWRVGEGGYGGVANLGGRWGCSNIAPRRFTPTSINAQFLCTRQAPIAIRLYHPGCLASPLLSNQYTFGDRKLLMTIDISNICVNRCFIVCWCQSMHLRALSRGVGVIRSTVAKTFKSSNCPHPDIFDNCEGEGEVPLLALTSP